MPLLAENVSSSPSSRSCSQHTRAIKSSREANVHRYTLLGFMIVAVLLANLLLVLTVSPLYR